MALNLMRSPADTLVTLVAEREKRLAALAAHTAAQPVPVDLAAVAAHRQEAGRLGLALGDAEEAVKFQTKAVEAASQERERAIDRRLHQATDRDAEAARKLVLGIIAQEEKLAADLGRLADHLAEVKAVNEQLAPRGFSSILDGEARARITEAHTVPARYRDESTWRLGDGSPVSLFSRSSLGELVPQEQGARLVSERVEVDPERHIPASAPASLTLAVRLPGLKGDSLWPKA